MAAEPSPDYPFQPAPFTAVHLTDSFWAPRIETNRLTTIPYAFGKCEETGRMDNFIRAAAVLQGRPLTNTNLPGYPFDDTDVYKVLEGASYVLAAQPDPKLRAYVDKVIAEIGAAQEPDGYLYTARTINPQHPHPWSGPRRWLRDPDESHELYDAGHLFEAAAAHYQATGETNLLGIALKEANLLCATFGPETNQLHLWPGHEVVEMGLVKLYRITGQRRYLDLAKYFIDVRGPGGDPYHQSHIKPVEQTEAVGHAVRAGYLYSGMADVAALTSDPRYLSAIDKIWENAAGKKLYVTGGIGAVPEGEAFGPDYFLPNMNAYCETCAAVANDYWNERLFLLHGGGKYVDVLERTLYNALLSGVSLDGKLFFYPNPLESDGQARAQPVVWLRLLPRQHHPLHGLRSRLFLCPAGPDDLRESFRLRRCGHQAGRRPHRQADAGDALSLGWRDPAHRRAGPAGPMGDSSSHPRLGAQRSGAGGPVHVC